MDFDHIKKIEATYTIHILPGGDTAKEQLEEGTLIATELALLTGEGFVEQMFAVNYDPSQFEDLQLFEDFDNAKWDLEEDGMVVCQIENSPHVENPEGLTALMKGLVKYFEKKAELWHQTRISYDYGIAVYEGIALFTVDPSQFENTKMAKYYFECADCELVFDHPDKIAQFTGPWVGDNGDDVYRAICVDCQCDELEAHLSAETRFA